MLSMAEGERSKDGASKGKDQHEGVRKSSRGTVQSIIELMDLEWRHYGHLWKAAYCYKINSDT